MENYLQYMKTLRSQMNDAEDQAAQVSVEEHTLIATIQTMETDLNSAKSEIKKQKEDTEKMLQERGKVCSQILEKQRKIASLESDSSSLSQTLELIQQERVSLSAKIRQKSAFYDNVADELNYKLQQQQDWVNSHKTSGELREHGVNDSFNAQAAETGGRPPIDNHLTKNNLGNGAREKLMAELDRAKAKLDDVAQMRAEIATENSKVKQSIEQVRGSAKEFKPELLAMDITALEQEYKALLSDKSGELEYLESLHNQIFKLKGTSHMIKCTCGAEYQVAMDRCA
ncbi:uncharacterized protein LOC126666163 [Mercurialis annua]|uniref:uncharacterized protein LOC126666163 n=1 Tax=Mercurialis annua TaxID=3986 RepID=UPI002160E480|nr:uncharacterized protein LOC126666163 [Mercurialis annua]